MIDRNLLMLLWVGNGGQYIFNLSVSYNVLQSFQSVYCWELVLANDGVCPNQDYVEENERCRFYQKHFLALKRYFHHLQCDHKTAQFFSIWFYVMSVSDWEIVSSLFIISNQSALIRLWLLHEKLILTSCCIQGIQGVRR